MDSERQLRPPRSNGALGSGIRLLLVDNEADWLAAIQTLLSRRKIETVAATSAPEALKILAEQPVDVVVLDLKMPGMGGLEALRKIKQRHPGVEVIILTGHASVDSTVEGMRLGAFDYLTKPCRVQELMEKVKQACHRKQALPPAATDLRPPAFTRSRRGAPPGRTGSGEE